MAAGCVATLNVATYFLNLKTVSRADGSSAVSWAAYRSGEKIRDNRTGLTYDHSSRQGVLHKEIILPSSVAAEAASWAQDRAHIWNSAERAEVRKDARVAREYLVVLPSELNPEQRLALAQGFAHELSDRYRFGVDLAVHAPRDFPGSDPRNFHAHLLATTREITPQGLGRKTTLEWRDSNRVAAGLGRAVNELFHVRERWAVHANTALKEAHIDARIDHRTLKAQGIERESKLWIPRIPYEMERRGQRSLVAEQIRQQHQERVAARESKQQALSPSQNSQLQAEPQQQRTSSEDVRQAALEAWQKYRQTRAPDKTAEEAAQAWKQYRETLGPPKTALDSARAWRDKYHGNRETGKTRDDLAQSLERSHGLNRGRGRDYDHEM
jgi:ATP-dependent exoDNAse (exonuclease V) alpha subunit